MTVEVTLLGTGSPLPDANRAGPATLVRAGSQTLLFDCGRAVVMRLAAAGVAPGALGAVFLTHLHSDHVWAFNDVLTTRWIAQFQEAPLTVVGPVGTNDFVDRTLAAMATDVGYRMTHHDDLNWAPSCRVTECEAGVAWEGGGVRVLAGLTDHGVVKPAIGYRVEAEGKVVVIAGDTVPCQGLDALCRDADIYVQTALRADLISRVPARRFQDVLDYHSTVEDAAGTAARAGARTLVLTHLVPAPPPGGEQEWVDLARAHFSGEVVAGPDLTTVTA